ncbi:MAG: undecaprenyldiphospho-muramoylpentapeptide beta-N-acetylglucosaminyltransferase [Firmicutes bacterium]|nr:undecaprenyldiphospho-muramoylpentapeptide beta-N-acetylglucosaminyltransferase [Bacillota bacterium]
MIVFEYNYGIMNVGDKMRVVISAGGTGGHIYPALAIINKIKEMEPNSEFLYIGTHNRMEKDIVPKHNIPFKSIEIYGFNRRNLLKNFKTIKCLIKAKKDCKKMIKEFNPDIAIGVGGYVTVPVIMASHELGIKTFIHEQNSVAGKANLTLSRYADIIGVSFKSSIDEFPKEKTIFTGNPCSEDAIKKTALSKSEFKLSKDKKLVLFVMGSLGASKVNEFLIDTMKLFNNKDYEILYVTGNKDYDKIKEIKFPSNVKVVPYIDSMTRIMKNTDLIVTRAGASTLSEIIALDLPSILIPSPYVPNNHQYKNALDLVNNNAAILIEEKDLEGDIIVRNIDRIINDDKKLNDMKKGLKTLKVDNSAEIIYKNIKKLIDRK